MLKGTGGIAAVVLVALILRTAYICFFVDLSRDYYWEYGEIAKNLHMGKGYSLFDYDGARFEFRASPSAAPCPSAFMMPGYVAFLYPFLAVTEIEVRNALILFVQALIGAGGVFLMFRFTDRYAGRREALVAAAVMACLPEFVYASGSYTPTVLFHLMFLALLPVVYGLWAGHTLRSELGAGALLAALIYIRPEIALFAAVCLVALLLGRRQRVALHVGAVIVILLLPWQIRNAVVFHEWIPFTTSGGLNFFRGHNSLELGTFADDAILQGFSGLPRGSGFEPELSRLYFRRACVYIGAEPAEEFVRTAKKLMQLWIRDSSDPRSMSFLYLIPWLFVLAGAVTGVVRGAAWRRHRILILYLVCASAVAVVFLVLPRYQTMMKVALVPFTAMGVISVWDMLRPKNGVEPSGPE